MSSKGDRVMKMFINFTQPVTAFFWITLDFYWDLWICGLWNQVSMAKRKIIHRSLQMLQSTLVPSSKMVHVRKDLELKICIGNSWFSSTAFESLPWVDQHIQLHLERPLKSSFCCFIFWGHWSISFQIVQQVSNWWGTSQELWQQLVSIRRSCWGMAVWLFQQILPESLKKLSYTWANWTHTGLGGLVISIPTDYNRHILLQYLSWLACFVAA